MTRSYFFSWQRDWWSAGSFTEERGSFILCHTRGPLLQLVSMCSKVHSLSSKLTYIVLEITIKRAVGTCSLPASVICHQLPVHWKHLATAVTTANWILEHFLQWFYSSFHSILKGQCLQVAFLLAHCSPCGSIESHFLWDHYLTALVVTLLPTYSHCLLWLSLFLSSPAIYILSHVDHISSSAPVSLPSVHWWGRSLMAPILFYNWGTRKPIPKGYSSNWHKLMTTFSQFGFFSVSWHADRAFEPCTECLNKDSIETTPCSSHEVTWMSCSCAKEGKCKITIYKLGEEMLPA